MPPRLARFNPADWSDDPDDLPDWWYFGRHRWLDARAAWLAGQEVEPRPVPPAGPAG